MLAHVVAEPGSMQRDLQGRKFTSHALVSHCKDGTQFVTHQRYSHFVLLHEQCYACLGLPKAFLPSTAPPLPSGSPSPNGFFSPPRHELLVGYLKMLIKKARGRLLPTLLVFLRSPPYVSAGATSTEAAAALHSAMAGQALALLRGHQTHPLALRAGADRLLEMSRDHAAHSYLVEVGTVEWFCSVLRRIVPGSPLLEIAADACVALECLLAGGLDARSEVCDLLRRCGALELLTTHMAAGVQEADVQANCISLIVSLCHANSEPEGTTSHFELRAISVVCAAMAAHSVNSSVQRHGCAALHITHPL